MSPNLTGVTDRERALIVNALHNKANDDRDAAASIAADGPDANEELAKTLWEQGASCDRLADALEVPE